MGLGASSTAHIPRDFPSTQSPRPATSPCHSPAPTPTRQMLEVRGEATARGQLSRWKANDSARVPGRAWAASVQIKTDGHRAGREWGVGFMRLPFL